MLYVLLCEDKAGAADLRLATRNDHLAWAQTQSGIRLAGPLLSDDGEQMRGSLFIIEADGRAGAEAFSAADPYTRAGLWQTVTIHRFRQVIPTP